MSREVESWFDNLSVSFKHSIRDSIRNVLEFQISFEIRFVSLRFFRIDIWDSINSNYTFVLDIWFESVFLYFVILSNSWIEDPKAFFRLLRLWLSLLLEPQRVFFFDFVPFGAGTRLAAPKWDTSRKGLISLSLESLSKYVGIGD